MRKSGTQGGMEGQERRCPHTSELLAATFRTHGCIPRTAAAGARGPVAVKPQAMYCIVRVLGIATRGLEEGARLGTTLTECAGQGGSDRVVADVVVPVAVQGALTPAGN